MSNQNVQELFEAPQRLIAQLEILNEVQSYIVGREAETKAYVHCVNNLKSELDKIEEFVALKKVEDSEGVKELIQKKKDEKHAEVETLKMVAKWNKEISEREENLLYLVSIAFENINRNKFGPMLERLFKTSDLINAGRKMVGIPLVDGIKVPLQDFAENKLIELEKEAQVWADYFTDNKSVDTTDATNNVAVETEKEIVYVPTPAPIEIPTEVPAEVPTETVPVEEAKVAPQDEPVENPTNDSAAPIAEDEAAPVVESEIVKEVVEAVEKEVEPEPEVETEIDAKRNQIKKRNFSSLLGSNDQDLVHSKSDGLVDPNYSFENVIEDASNEVVENEAEPKNRSTEKEGISFDEGGISLDDTEEVEIENKKTPEPMSEQERKEDEYRTLEAMGAIPSKSNEDIQTVGSGTDSDEWEGGEYDDEEDLGVIDPEHDQNPYINDFPEQYRTPLKRDAENEEEKEEEISRGNVIDADKDQFSY